MPSQERLIAPTTKHILAENAKGVVMAPKISVSPIQKVFKGITINKEKSVSDQTKNDTTGRKGAVNKALANSFYRENYYCGTDVGLYIGGTWVDDVISIQYTLSNNKAPVHGYMSEEFDAVARGTYIIQGQLAIAFKENGYLRNILDEYQGLQAGPATISEATEAQTTADQTNDPDEDATRRGPFRADKYGYLSTAYEKSIGKGFDIFLTFGDSSGEFRGGTVVTLEDCHITSQSLVAQPTGDPIAEVYSFFARTIKSQDPGTSWLSSGDPVDTQLHQNVGAIDDPAFASKGQAQAYADFSKEWNQTHQGQAIPSYTAWVVADRDGTIASTLRPDELRYVEDLETIEDSVPAVEDKVKELMVITGITDDPHDKAKFEAGQAELTKKHDDLFKAQDNTETMLGILMNVESGMSKIINK